MNSFAGFTKVLWRRLGRLLAIILLLVSFINRIDAALVPFRIQEGILRINIATRAIGIYGGSIFYTNEEGRCFVENDGEQDEQKLREASFEESFAIYSYLNKNRSKVSRDMVETSLSFLRGPDGKAFKIDTVKKNEIEKVKNSGGFISTGFYQIGSIGNTFYKDEKGTLWVQIRPSDNKLTVRSAKLEEQDAINEFITVSRNIKGIDWRPVADTIKAQEKSAIPSNVREKIAALKKKQGCGPSELLVIDDLCCPGEEACCNICRQPLSAVVEKNLPGFVELSNNAPNYVVPNPDKNQPYPCNHCFHTKCILPLLVDVFGNFKKVFLLGNDLDAPHYESACCPVCKRDQPMKDLYEQIREYLSEPIFEQDGSSIDEVDLYAYSILFDAADKIYQEVRSVDQDQELVNYIHKIDQENTNLIEAICKAYTEYKMNLSCIEEVKQWRFSLAQHEWLGDENPLPGGRFPRVCLFIKKIASEGALGPQKAKLVGLHVLNAILREGYKDAFNNI